MGALLGVVDAGGEGAQGGLEGARRFEPHFVDGVQEEPGFSAPLQPALEGGGVSDLKGGSEIVVDVFDADEESGVSPLDEPFGFGAQLEGLPGASVGEEDDSVLALQLAPLHALAAQMKHPRFVERLAALSVAARDCDEVADQGDGVHPVRAPASIG